ncbi:DUF2249 domain-containing protein [Brucella intermedia]|uniref:DUF2249 domain-containing protein n=1 Tax=Brucella intermedia TaxID=94625 RepID=UPI00124D6027|nr:DUF2249 domain-containing protein [Brucella intermedia]KAB2718107.1 DUF2249 domain-containing protein [Brucella intermedia]
MSAEPVSLSPVIDVRTIPPISRHATIFAMIDALEPGEALEIVNDHDPVPLRRQLETRNPGAFSWVYKETGPLWRVEIGRGKIHHGADHECSCGNH